MQKNIFRCCLRQTLLLLAVSHISVANAEIEQVFAHELDQIAPYEEVTVIVTMKEMLRPEVHSASELGKRNGNLVRALKQHAEVSQSEIRQHIERNGGKHLKDIWIINGMVLKLRADQLRELAAQPGVVSIRRDEIVSYAAPLAVSGSPLPEWNLNALHLPDVWAAGATGKGVVVATMDTGVDVTHPDIAGKWRGGNNSWFDPHGQHATPFDAIGHGTQVMGVLVGGNTSGVKIGVATDAKYIAAKIFDDNGNSTYSAIHAAFQWMLDPDGNPATQDAPDVVNASWGLPGSNNKCNVEFDTDIRMLKAANIALVFAGGNDGPAPATGVSPANSAGVISSGAVGSTLDIANFSSRGPSPCTNGIFPTLVAPGDGIYTIDLTTAGTSNYTTVAGSSFAAPHVAGVLALLAGKFPGLTVADLENALTQTSRDLGDVGGDNIYGVGLLDAKAALLALTARPAGNTPVVTSLPPVVAMQGTAYSYQVKATDADGDHLVYSLDVFPLGMTISASGQIFWIPGSNQVGQQLVKLRVKDATGLYVIQTFVVVVENVNNAPVANDDRYTMIQATRLTVDAAGVLTNDTDRDSNRLVAVNYSSATTGTLSGNEDGSFVYIPPSPNFVGIVTFTYQASDGGLTSAAATVTINVLPAAGSILGKPVSPLPVVINPPAMTLPGSFPGDPESVPPQNSSVPDVTAEDVQKMDTGKPSETAKKDAAASEEVAPIITSSAVEVAKLGELYSYQVMLNEDEAKEHVFTLDIAPKGMTISTTGLINWQPTKSQISNQKIVVRVTDSPRLYTIQSYMIAFENINEVPVAMTDSYTLLQPGILKIAAPGVLKNDKDAYMSPLTVASYSVPSVGKLEGKPDGSFVYTPPSPSYIGNVTFTYKASDGELMSENASVTINVIHNRAPVANEDFVNARIHLRGLEYTPIRIKVLDNDIDPDTELDPSNKIAPATLKIVKQPKQGGKLSLDPQGVISYTPAINFKGVDTLSYTVKDTRDAQSKPASVRIDVR